MLDDENVHRYSARFEPQTKFRQRIDVSRRSRLDDRGLTRWNESKREIEAPAKIRRVHHRHQ